MINIIGQPLKINLICVQPLHMIEAHEAYLTFHGIGGARRLQKAANILFISHDLSLLGFSFLLLAFRSDPANDHIFVIMTTIIQRESFYTLNYVNM